MKPRKKTATGLGFAIAWMYVNPLEIRHRLEMWHTLMIVEFRVVVTEAGRPFPQLDFVDPRWDTRFVRHLNGAAFVF